jgi:DNA helicase-2/ATP-dependent DNA helicase PcrA
MAIRLTDEQRRVVEHRGGPLRVVAGPGTGKTSCLAARIMKLILTDRVPPNRILAVTFTRAAAGEMRQKLEKEGVAPHRIPDVRTLHSKAVALLRRHSALLNLNANVRPLGSLEVNLVLKDIAADLASAGFRLPFRGPQNIQKYLRAYQSEQSGAGIPGWISSNRKYLKTYHEFSRAYEGLQGFYNGIDWFRVVNLPLQLLSSHADVLEKERAAVDHMLVDEYQDLNRKDQDLIRILAGDASGLCVVGDEDQSIYESQRFAAPAGLVDFDRSVRGTTTLTLTYCHRCPKQILEKANALIKKNKIRLRSKPPLRPVDPTRKGVVATVSQKSKKAEIEWLVKKVLQLHGKGFEYRDILTLFTEGKIGQDYVSAVQRANIPLTVQLRVAGPFESTCFVRVLATLRFLADQADNLALRQCLEYWPNLGATTIRELRQLATGQHQTLWEAVREVATNPDEHRSIARRKSVGDFRSAMTKLLRIRDFGRLLPAILKHLPDCATDPGVEILSEFFEKQRGKEAALNISEILQNFEQEREAGKFETTEELPDRVRVMTMHSAKGLEAKVVIIPALEDDIIPGEFPNLEERRRLFYVSITRAKEILLLSWASQRIGPEIHRPGGRMLGKQRSRFLKEMGE